MADASDSSCKVMARIPLVLDQETVLVDFFVLDSLVLDCLVGFQFCREQQLVIDLATNTVKVYRPEKDIVCSLVSNNATIVDGEEQPVLRAAEKVTLAPFTEQLVAAVGIGQTGSSYLVNNGQG